jgi:phenylacetate-coenzyme A ligase PaaK-like adenylate-forming protein
MVENIGVVYPDCEHLNKHVPIFADVTVRSPLTLEPVREGATGILQVGSLLPESFPGHLLLTEDLGTVVTYDGCPCGRRGLAFRLAGRIPQAELRGCGDVLAQRVAA